MTEENDRRKQEGEREEKPKHKKENDSNNLSQQEKYLLSREYDPVDIIVMSHILNCEVFRRDK